MREKYIFTMNNLSSPFKVKFVSLNYNIAKNYIDYQRIKRQIIFFDEEEY